MKRSLLVAIVLSAFMFALPADVFSQVLKGHIYDAKTKEPLVGAAVSYVSDGNRGTVSDVNGAYELPVPEGKVRVTYSYLGYNDRELVVAVRGGEARVADVYLTESTEMLEEVVVSVGRFEQKLSDVTVSMEVLGADDIAKHSPADITASLRNVPGIDVVDKQPSIRGGSGWTYGVGARCQVLVDGMSALNPQNGAINWNTVPVYNVDQIEVIKGASSVLYGSSALNGIINVRTARPGLSPETHFSTYLGIYGNPANPDYEWADEGFWKDGKFPVRPLLRSSLYSGIRNPIYEGYDFSHSRRMGNFDVSGGVNLFTDEGYREQGYNKRFRVGGNVTYHQPDMGDKILNYGLNVNFMSNDFADFIIWRSPEEALRPSPFTNMGRQENSVKLDPFFNYTDTERNITHKLKGRFFYSNCNINRPSSGQLITDILGNMGTDAQAIQDIAQGDLSILQPLIQPLLQGDLYGVIDGVFTMGESIFPDATTADYCDLIAWFMSNGLPEDLASAFEGKLPSGLVPWLSGVVNPARTEDAPHTDNNYDYYLDYQFSKELDGGARLTAGATYEHIRYNSAVMGEVHKSDNAALYFQYDQRFWDRLSVSAGVRAEYYRVDNHYREAETKLFGTSVPFRPVFRGGLNYRLADYSFLRASFGQGYRNPSLQEKFLLKDIGGVGIFPNLDLKAEKGFNAEIGFKQGYRWGKLKGMVDVAGFYTQYKDMIEFYIGLFDKSNYQPINSSLAALTSLIGGNIGIGAQFHNVSKAQIYGMEISTSGQYEFSKNASLTYNLGYVYTEPRDADYKERKEREDKYTDALQMKEKSNDSPYLKYRQKHSAKASLDLQWKRLNLGLNMNWRSKINAVDFFMLDERDKANPDMMDYIRNIVFGNIDGENLASYWEKHNKGIFTMDLRLGVEMAEWISVQFMVNNLLNKEYSYRPMSIEAPRTFVIKLDLNI